MTERRLTKPRSTNEILSYLTDFFENKHKVGTTIVLEKTLDQNKGWTMKIWDEC